MPERPFYQPRINVAVGFLPTPRKPHAPRHVDPHNLETPHLFDECKHPAATPPVRSADIQLRRAGGEPSRVTAVLIKRAISQWTGRIQHGLIGVTREDAHWWHVSLFDHVVVTMPRSPAAGSVA